MYITLTFFSTNLKNYGNYTGFRQLGTSTMIFIIYGG